MHEKQHFLPFLSIVQKNYTILAINRKNIADMELINHIIPRVVARRKMLKYTQKDMAELTGLSERTIRAVERGEGSTSIASFIKILDVLGLELSLLFKPMSNETRKSVL